MSANKIKSTGYGGLLSNDDEVFIAIKSDTELQDKLRAMIFEDMGFKQQRNTNPKKTLIAYAKKLAKEVEKKLKISGVEFEGSLFSEQIEYDERKKCVVLNFSDDTFQKNIFQTHVSFVPVLYNYGWEVGGKKYHYSNSNGMPSFRYYAGSYFITEAIKEFNNSHKDKNLYADFMLGDMNLTLYEGNSKLPYIKRYL